MLLRTVGTLKVSTLKRDKANRLERMTMLVLTRRVMQSIMIGDEVEVIVTEVKGEKVRLGIVAPPHVAIHRREVYERIQSQKEALPYRNGNLQLVTTDLLPDL